MSQSMATNLSFTNTTLATPTEMDYRKSVVDAEHIILYLALSFFSILGVIGNAIAFYIFFKRRNSSTSVIFILALAGTDFITCLVTVPFTMVFEAMLYRLYYDGLCKLYMFFVTSTIPFSSLIMAGIAVDRYLCICHPFLHVLNVQRARIAVLCLALPAFTFGIITSMSHGQFLMQKRLLINGTFLLGTNISKEKVVQPLFRPYSFLNVSDMAANMADGHLIEHVTLENDTGLYPVQMYKELVRNPECTMNDMYFSENFQEWFHNIYTSCYVLCFITVMVLYVLIYKSIFTRRAMKAKRRKKNYYTSVAITDTHAPAPKTHNRGPGTPAEADTVLSEVNGNDNGGGTTAATTTTTTTTTTSTTTTTATATTTSSISSVQAPTTPVTTTTSLTTDEEEGENVTTSTSLMEPQQQEDGGEEEEEEEEGEGKEGKKVEAGSDVSKSREPREKDANGARKFNGTTSATTAVATNTAGAGDNAAGEATRIPKRRGSATRDRNLYANIKTAMMLFVVTLVFIVAFAPACFMAHGIVPVQLNVFYMYFIYNVANPFIYAFMNQSFREVLKKLLKRS
ncbi:hypothetical protein ACOMHN_064272 [Nucella lapillus]